MQSHIIPEFLYKPMYDEKHRFMILNPDPNKPIRHGQKGLRETLLCHECEQRLSVYERYFSRLLFGGIEFSGTRNAQVQQISGLDYKLTRLFHLSILWRMGVSSLKMFRHVDLGPHEEKLRQMILADDPGKADEFGFLTYLVLIDGKPHFDMLLQPSPGRVEGMTVYRAVISGLFYLFFVDSRPIPKHLKQGLFTEEGRWTIMNADARKIPLLNDTFVELSMAERARKNRSERLND